MSYKPPDAVDDLSGLDKHTLSERGKRFFLTTIHLVGCKVHPQCPAYDITKDQLAAEARVCEIEADVNAKYGGSARLLGVPMIPDFVVEMYARVIKVRQGEHNSGRARANASFIAADDFFTKRLKEWNYEHPNGRKLWVWLRQSSIFISFEGGYFSTFLSYGWDETRNF